MNAILTQSLLVITMLAQPLAAEQSTPRIDAAQFGRISESEILNIQDVEFVYEGGLRRGVRDTEEPSTMFQGVYRYRNDGATLWDLFSTASSEPGGNDSGGRIIESILAGVLTKISHHPDLGVTRVTTSRGGPGSFDQSTSPERFLSYWFFQAIGDPASHGYEFQGWEDIDGHRCLRVRISLYSDQKYGDLPPEKRFWSQFWIDLERGGHPLRIEEYAGTSLVVRTDQIELAQVPFEGDRLIWFPVKARTSTYGGTSVSMQPTHSSTPNSVEFYSVVSGSIRFNRGLDDSAFSVVDQVSANLPDARLSQLRDSLNAATRQAYAKHRTDPEGVRQQLEERLAEADRQSAMLDASAAARVSRSWASAGQVGFILLGVALIGGALYWRMRT